MDGAYITYRGIADEICIWDVEEKRIVWEHSYPTIDIVRMTSIMYCWKDRSTTLINVVVVDKNHGKLSVFHHGDINTPSAQFRRAVPFLTPDY